MKKRKGVLNVDVSRCMGCHSCEMACAIAHSESKELLGAIRQKVRPQSRVHLEVVDEVVVPLQCRQCEDAPCIAVCPTGSLERFGLGQPLVHHEDKCIGCKMCTVICPFGVITQRSDGKSVIVCDLCMERAVNGEDPACVYGCPTHALKCMTLEEIAKEKRRKAAESMKKADEDSKHTVGTD
ncbi:4Fe-4S dicluster domain-containing protein [Candidatus Hydrogenedentota bacterium]